jgi:hypothetical protein
MSESLKKELDNLETFAFGTKFNIILSHSSKTGRWSLVDDYVAMVEQLQPLSTLLATVQQNTRTHCTQAASDECAAARTLQLLATRADKIRTDGTAFLQRLNQQHLSDAAKELEVSGHIYDMVWQLSTRSTMGFWVSNPFRPEWDAQNLHLPSAQRKGSRPAAYIFMHDKKLLSWARANGGTDGLYGESLPWMYALPGTTDPDYGLHIALTCGAVTALLSRLGIRLPKFIDLHWQTFVDGMDIPAADMHLYASGSGVRTTVYACSADMYEGQHPDSCGQRSLSLITPIRGNKAIPKWGQATGTQAKSALNINKYPSHKCYPPLLSLPIQHMIASYHFVALFVEQLDPVDAFEFDSCTEAIAHVEAALDEVTYWSQKIYVSVLDENGRWSSMITPSFHTLLTQLVPKLKQRFAATGKCTVADISTCIMEYGHSRTKRCADKHSGRGGDQKGRGCWAEQVLTSATSIGLAKMTFSRMFRLARARHRCRYKKQNPLRLASKQEVTAAVAFRRSCCADPTCASHAVCNWKHGPDACVGFDASVYPPQASPRCKLDARAAPATPSPALATSSSDDISRMTVAELKTALRSIGERVSGRKAELVQRLRDARVAATAAAPAAAPAAATPTPAAATTQAAATAAAPAAAPAAAAAATTTQEDYDEGDYDDGCDLDGAVECVEGMPVDASEHADTCDALDGQCALEGGDHEDWEECDEESLEEEMEREEEEGYEQNDDDDEM